MKGVISWVLMFLFSVVVFGQPIDRPSRLGEDIPEHEKNETRPAVDRRTQIKKDALKPLFIIDVGFGAPDKTEWARISAGARRNSLSFGASLAYTDYSRSFIGTRKSYMGDGDRNIAEKGNFIHYEVFVGYDISLKYILITPIARIGKADIVTRRWDTDTLADSTRFVRSRLINSWGFHVAYPIGKFRVGGEIEWFVVNPWFYFYPNDFGFIRAGIMLGF